MNYDELIKNMPQNLNKIEQARFLYIQLGKYFSYDEKFITSDDTGEKQNIANRNIEDIQDNNVVCTSMARIYTTLLNRIGINAKIVFIPTERFGHSYTKIKIDGQIYSTDLIHDLMNIKVGNKTKEFMSKDTKGENTKYSILSEDELKCIDDKLGYTYKGLYMEDFCKILREEMASLDDMDSPAGKELREQFKLEEKSEKEILYFKIDFIVKHIGHENLHCLEKSDYFKAMIMNCLNVKHFSKYYDLSSITCIDKNSNISIFHVLQDKQNKQKSIYMIPHKGNIKQVTQEIVRKNFSNGMKTLSKSREQEFKQILLEDEEKSNLFSEQEIGKNTINIPTQVKDKVQDKIKREKKTIFQNKEQKNEIGF